MYYKNYGNTNHKVSAIGLGTMRYNDDDVKNKLYEKCSEIPLYAYEKGINYFDTAPSYCFDKSEYITGLAVKQMPRGEIFLSSKTNFDAIGLDDLSEDAFFRRLESTLENLNTDYLDFYHLWCMLTPEGYNNQKDVLYKFFEKAKSQGMIRHIVFSSHMQGSYIENIVDSGLFDGMLIGYNALNYKFRQSGIEKAYKNGMGVVAMNPLGGGLIPQNPETFKNLAKGTDLNVAAAALRFVASHKEITITLAGCSELSHIDDAVSAVENLEEMTAAEITGKYESAGLGFNDLCTGCGYCKGCPQDVQIPKFMDAYNQLMLSGDEAQLKDRLLYHWHLAEKDAAKCIACGLCESECTQHLPIIDRLRKISVL